MEKKTRRKTIICLSIFSAICVAMLISLAFSAKIEKTFGLKKTKVDNCTFRFDVIDVGQGAASLVTFETGEHMLIDAGTNSSEKSLVSYLKNLKISTIEYFVITHSDNDHTGGADAVYENFEIVKTYRPFILAENEMFNEDPLQPYKSDMDVIGVSDWIECVRLMYAETYTKNGETHESEVEVISDMSFVICGTSGVRFFWPKSTEESISPLCETLGYVSEKCTSINNYSPIMLLTYYDIEIVITGDADDSVEKKVLTALEARGDLDLISNIDIYVAGHHGSNYSSCKKFLETLLPSYVVVQCGNSSKHPHENFVSRLQSVWKDNLKTGEFLRTDKNKNVVFKFDGSDASNIKQDVLYSGDGISNQVRWWQIVVCTISVAAVLFIVPIIPKRRHRRRR